MPPGAPRVLLIGLDGVPWHVLARRFERGETPFLAGLAGAGSTGTLMSVTPAVTAPAWTTFQTGVSPGSHGVLDFRMLRPGTYRTVRTDGDSHGLETVWEAVSRHGGRAIAVNVPMTWPPREVSGVVVSGMLTPSVASDFIRPRSLRERLLAAAPGYEILIPSARAHGMGLEAFAAALAGMAKARAALGAEALRAVPGADLAMVHFQSTDVLLHAAYPACDPADRRHDAADEEAVAPFWRALDESVAALAAPALEEGATVVVLSDHGFGPIDRIAYANAFLARAGWQRRRRGQLLVRTALRALRRSLPIPVVRRLARASGMAGRVASKVTDWSRTAAFQPAGWVGGFLHLNREGHHPQGLVPAAEAETLRAEIAAALEAWRGPDGRPVVARARRGEEVWPGLAPPEAADLYLEAADGVELSASFMEAQPGPVPTDPSDRLRHHVGSHRPEGVYLAAGPGVAAGKGPVHGLADLAPTVLALLGMPAGDHLEGRVMGEVFGGLAAAGGEEARPGTRAAPAGRGEEAETEERLRDLGYL